MTAVRVLHVVGQMNRGGVETWLMQVLRTLDPACVRMDFLVTRGDPGHFDAEIDALGSAVIPCESPSSPTRFARQFLAVLRERGPYHVVHSHVHHFSGFTLALAHRASVPVRIAHAHSDTSHLDARASPWRRIYLRLMKAAVRRYATHGLAASSAAATSLFGPRWPDVGRYEVVRCGLDFSAFRKPIAESASARADLGVPPRALVLGHVGRFDGCKNQAFLVRIAMAALKLEPSTFLVLVGDGPLRASVEADATRLGIRERVVFAGVRADVPRVLASFDVFVLPSVREGLPLVGLEAQAAGLPIVLSDIITRELVVIPSLFTWRAPTDSPESWAEAALSAARGGVSRADAAATLERSEYSLSRSLPRLLEVYGVTSSATRIAG
ncbi:glycosyltransferase [Anaeromyxobacter terrae]|uniref:glycosyltransferase n=1 Tax=Anaeromyxobacter terrae TaxID=2925406 RepID=UPI001F5A9263|nr:glycosyltransferase [Anaeromyxobacter sp. SG22]